MTVIIIDQENRRVLTDSRVTRDGEVVHDDEKKIHTMFGKVYAGTGSLTTRNVFYNIIIDNEGLPNKSKHVIKRNKYISYTEIFAVDKSSIIKYSISKYFDFFFWTIMRVDKQTITQESPIFSGSGGDFAEGCYYHSKDTKEAVKAAIHCDPCCGGTIQEAVY